MGVRIREVVDEITVTGPDALKLVALAVSLYTSVSEIPPKTEYTIPSFRISADTHDLLRRLAT